MLRIHYLIDILWLIAFLTSYISLNLVLILPFPRLIGLVLSINLVEPPGALIGYVIKAAAFDPTVEAAANYSLEVSLIAVKHLVPRIVLL
jgi:hypothetical protein